MSAPGGRPPSSGKGVAIQGLKLPFVVQFASSYEEGYEPIQLEQGGAAAAAAAAAKANAANGGEGGEEAKQQVTTHIKGWQSAKYCPYPQTLVLKFPGYFDIRKIQILSHQAKIANTIEIYAGVSPSLDGDDSQASYTRLGYLTLDSNERSGFKARELKSVYVQSRGNFLKLIIKKCYANQINQFNQVGIIAINIVGTKSTGDPFVQPMISEAGGMGAGGGSSAASGNAAGVIQSLISQYNCDEKTAHKIFDLEKLKSRAIAAEDYDEAKKLKVHLDSLKELGGRLAQLEKQKVQAVAREDYDLAKQLKKEIDFLRGNAHAASSSSSHSQPKRGPSQQQQGYGSAAPLSRNTSQKHVGGGGGSGSQRDGYNDGYNQHDAYGQHDQYAAPASLQHQDSLPSSVQHQHMHHHDQPQEEEHGHESGAPPQHQPDDGGDPEDRPIRPSRNAAAMVEDDGVNPLSRQPTQSVNHGGYDPFDEQDPDGVGNPNSAVPAPEAIAAGARKDLEPLIDIFGEHTIQCLYSKHWLLRQQAIKDITQTVLENSNDVPIKDLFINSCKVLKRGLSDKVSQIFLSACQFLQVLLKTLAMKLKVEDVKLQLDPIVVAMMEKLSSSNVRERDGGMQVLTFLAFDSHVHPSLVPSNLLQPLKQKEKDSPLPLKTRAKILLKCVINYGLEDSFALSLGALTKFIVPHLLHRDAGVRDGMVNLLAGISSIIGVQKLLPHLKDIRPQTMETLQQRLDDVANGATVFLKPVQPSLDQPYVSENDPTHTVNGVAVSSASAGVSAPQPMAAPAPAAKPRQQQQHASPPPKQPKPGAGGHHAQQKGGGGGAKHAAHAQQHHQAPPIAEEEASTDLTGKCQFCGLEDPTFTEEKLDLHYWADCVYLISCKSCEQVIEIPTLNEHLLQECEVQGTYKECPTCFEPILASNYSAHVAAQDCQPPAAGMARCALCHTDVEKSDEGWKNHLLVDRCPKNTRGTKR